MGYIKADKVRKINDKTLLVALDISQEKYEGYFRCPDGTEIKQFEFCNNRHGYEKLWGRICEGVSHRNDNFLLSFTIIFNKSNSACWMFEGAVRSFL